VGLRCADGSSGTAELPRTILSSETTSLPFDGPYILKPRFGGSSIGIEVVADLATARARLDVNEHFSLGCVVEPYREDLGDLQIAMRSYPNLELSAVERPLRRSENAEILNYRDKYVGGEGMVSAPRELPAVLSGEQHDAVLRYARGVAGLCGLRGVARLDFLANDHELYVNEINTIPGSLAKYLFVDPPLAFSALLGDLLREARERPAHRYSAAGADGLVLRSAGLHRRQTRVVAARGPARQSARRCRGRSTVPAGGPRTPVRSCLDQATRGAPRARPTRRRAPGAHRVPRRGTTRSPAAHWRAARPSPTTGLGGEFGAASSLSGRARATRWRSARRRSRVRG
jgi:hypothetical protein